MNQQESTRWYPFSWWQSGYKVDPLTTPYPSPSLAPAVGPGWEEEFEAPTITNLRGNVTDSAGAGTSPTTCPVRSNQLVRDHSKSPSRLGFQLVTGSNAKTKPCWYTSNHQPPGFSPMLEREKIRKQYWTSRCEVTDINRHRAASTCNNHGLRGIGHIS